MKPILTLSFVLVSYLAFSQHTYSCQEGEVAFGGYDLVSYFQDGPVLGKKEITATHDGIVLQFATQENKKTFQSSPSKYLPAYGGWCATAIANNTFVVPNFSMYKIQDGELLFFEVRGFFNGKSQWEKDPQKHEILADQTYRKVVDLKKDVD